MTRCAKLTWRSPCDGGCGAGSGKGAGFRHGPAPTGDGIQARAMMRVPHAARAAAAARPAPVAWFGGAILGDAPGSAGRTRAPVTSALPAIWLCRPALAGGGPGVHT
jgi:hypothetical protein